MEFLSVKLKNFKIIYKLRPEENFSEIKNFINFDTKNILFLKKISENKLKKTIAESQYVVGTNSTLLAESLGYTNVIIYKKGWYQEYKDFIRENIFFSAKNCKEVLYIIQTKKNAKKKINLNNLFQRPNIIIFKNLFKTKTNV